ncbi:MAG: hypothetical protein AAGU14_01245 [Eubacteriaceae bacterium]
MKKNKKFLIGILIILIAITLASCKSAASGGSNSGSSSVQNKALEGYPENLLPLYEAEKISSCSFSVVNDNFVNLGKNYYSLAYLSKGTVAEIDKHYRDKMTVTQSYAEGSFSGTIDNRNVSLMASKHDDKLSYVTIKVGVKQEDWVTENTFFKDYPQGVMEIVEPNNLLEQTYDRQFSLYEDKTINRYVKKYTTTMQTDKIIAFYQDKYKDMAGFMVRTDQYSTVIFFKPDTYECQVTITKGSSNNFRYLQTEIRKYN